MDVSDLPAVDSLADELTDGYGIYHPVAVAIARDVLAGARREIEDGGAPDVTERAQRRARALFGSRIRPVVNATGVLLHTNLGRAPLPEPAPLRAARLQAAKAPRRRIPPARTGGCGFRSRDHARTDTGSSRSPPPWGRISR